MSNTNTDIFNWWWDLVYYKKIKHINKIKIDLPIKNDMDFVIWKIELNKDLLSFWESITEDIKE